MPSKNIYRTLHIGLYIFVAAAILYLIANFSYTEGFQSTPTPVYPVCFLCVKPPELFLHNLLKMTLTQPIYIVCDSNDYEPPKQLMSEDYTAVVLTEASNNNDYVVSPNTLYFIQIKDEECGKRGYINAASTIPKKPSAWDKALYYFCLKTTARHIWFIEEDVFVPRPNIMDEMNARYPNTDLVTKQHVSEKDDPGFYWWFDAEEKMDRPYYRSLVCATRVSRRILDKVATMAKEKRTVCFVETIFSTIAHQNNFSIVQAPELQSVIFRHSWTKETVHMNGLFHPVKEMTDHIAFREHLESKSD
jgi:hypothetical protein